MSPFVGHFVSSPREREKSDGRDSRDESEGQGRKRNWNEREKTEEIKHPPSTLTCYKDSRHCPTISQYQLVHPTISTWSQDFFFFFFFFFFSCPPSPHSVIDDDDDDDDDVKFNDVSTHEGHLCQYGILTWVDIGTAKKKSHIESEIA